MNYEEICKRIHERIHYYEYKYGLTPNRIILGIEIFLLIRNYERSAIRGYRAYEEFRSEGKPIHMMFGIKAVVSHDNSHEISVGYVEEINM